MPTELISGRLLGLLGSILVTISLLMIPSLVMGLVDNSPEVVSAFAVSGIVSSLFGLLFIFAFHGSKSTDKMTVAMAGTILTGFIIALFCGLPSMFLSTETSVVMGFFDGMSALTTMGVSSFPDIDAMPRGLILWIATVGWFGGFLSIAVMLSILTACNSGGMQMHVSPISRVITGGIQGRLFSAGKALLPIYSGLTFICFILLSVGSMPFFDAVIRSLGAISTTGVYLPGDGASISGFWNQLVMVIFMLVGMFNLDYHYAWFKGQRHIYRVHIRQFHEVSTSGCRRSGRGRSGSNPAGG